MSDIDALRDQWKELYSNTLPSLALSKSSKQPRWPVHVDHCFGRIILDDIVGEGGPWHAKLKGPAVKNMNAEQLRKCVELGQAIADGKENLVDLDEKSLRGRGKASKKREHNDDNDAGIAKKAKKEHTEERLDSEKQSDIRSTMIPSSNSKTSMELSQSLDNGDGHNSKKSHNSHASDSESDGSSSMEDVAQLIQTSSLTPYRRRVLLALLQVPRGRYTTYAAMSSFLQSSARAVGNAMRNNPFAPKVPCHRVVAADGTIGGFGGQWGAEGKFAAEKKKLLRAEGVKFDGKGKVVGSVWKGFKVKI